MIAYLGISGVMSAVGEQGAVECFDDGVNFGGKRAIPFFPMWVRVVRW